MKLQNLNFPNYKFRFKSRKNNTLIFDRIRKKFVILKPEEWVRQHCISYLIEEKCYPESHINVEKNIKVYNLTKRYDVVVYNPDGSIQLIVECKSPGTKINQESFDQIARYNLTLNARFLMLTNGINHYYCTMDISKQTYHFLKQIPNFLK